MCLLLLLIVLFVGCKIIEYVVNEISEILLGIIYYKGEIFKKSVEEFEKLLVSSCN